MGRRRTLGPAQGGLRIEPKGSMPHSRALSPPHTPPSISESGWLGCEVGGFSLHSEVRASMSLDKKDRCCTITLQVRGSMRDILGPLDLLGSGKPKSGNLMSTS